MQSITYRERPLAYRRLINGLLMLGTVGAFAWSVYEALQPGAADWDPFEIILILIVWIVADFAMRRASVTFDDRGLTYAIDSKSRYWSWSELSAPEIQRLDGKAAYIRFRPDRLDWMARLGWLGWRSRPEIRIPQDSYDAPLSEISARLNDCRDRALADDGAAAHIETDDRGSTIVVYRERAGRGSWPALMVFLMIGAFLVISENFLFRDSGVVSWDFLLFLPFFAVVFWSVIDARIYANIGRKGASTLKLDDQGLTYMYGEIIRTWKWAELSAPEIPGGGQDDRPFMRLRPSSRADWVARIFMPSVSLNGAEIRIRPIFDAPLTDIAAMLNEYRDRALGTVSTTATT